MTPLEEEGELLVCCLSQCLLIIQKVLALEPCCWGVLIWPLCHPVGLGAGNRCKYGDAQLGESVMNNGL
jgi:hypothetical protein